MANATNIYVKDFQNGQTYKDWTALSSDAWTAYAGYGYGSNNWVTAIKFRVSAPATSVSFSWIAWSSEGGYRDLKYKITESESSTYNNATSSTAGDGTFTAVSGQYERTTLNVTKALKPGVDYVLYLWTNRSTSYESYTSIRVWNASTYPLTVTYTEAASYKLSTSVGSNVTATVAINSSPFGRTGNLSNGATIYAGEILKLTYTVATGYAILTHTLNNTTVNSGDTHTVAGAVNIVLSAQASTSTISTSNGTFGTSQTISVTRYNSNYTHTIVATCAGKTMTICTKSNSTSISWDAWAASIRAAAAGQSVLDAIPNAMSASCVLTCTTYNGNTSLGSTSITITLSLPTSGEFDVDPTPALAVNDAAGLAPTYGGYVQGKSRAYVSVDDGLQYSASAVSRSTTANGSTYSGAYFTTGTLQTSGNNTISTTVRDSRGRTGSGSAQITVLPYAAPAITAFTVHRCDSQGAADDDGNYFNIVYTAVVSELGGHNGKTLKWRYKEVGSSTWSNWHTETMQSYSQSGSTTAEDITTGVANGTSYDVELALTDSFSTVTKSTQLSTTPVTIDLNEYGDAIGFGKAPAFRKAFDLGDWTAIGRVQGLGKAREEIPTNADLDDYDNPGVYAIVRNATAETLGHRPTDIAGTLRVWNSLGNETNPGETWYYVLQEYVNLYGDTWRRRGESNGGTTINWSAWSFYAGRQSYMQDFLGLSALQTYTPTFVWSDSSTLTTSSVFGYYAQIGRVLFISARCRITNLGTTGDKYLLMSLPSGYTTASTAIYSTIGNVVPPIGHTYQYLIRPAGASSPNLSIHCGGGADYPRSVMVTGYYAFMAIVPIE